MTELMRSLCHAVDVIAVIRARLEDEGAVVELGMLQRLSVDELDLLVRLELEAA